MMTQTLCGTFGKIYSSNAFHDLKELTDVDIDVYQLIIGNLIYLNAEDVGKGNVKRQTVE